MAGTKRLCVMADSSSEDNEDSLPALPFTQPAADGCGGRLGRARRNALESSSEEVVDHSHNHSRSKGDLNWSKGSCSDSADFKPNGGERSDYFENNRVCSLIEGKVDVKGASSKDLERRKSRLKNLTTARKTHTLNALSSENNVIQKEDDLILNVRSLK